MLSCARSRRLSPGFEPPAARPSPWFCPGPDGFGGATRCHTFARRTAEEMRGSWLRSPGAATNGGKMNTIIVLVALLVSACSCVGRAASLPVVIEQLNATAKTCGISEPGLESVARRTLEDSQVHPDADAGGWLNVRVTVARTARNPCVARISVRMKAFSKRSPSGALTNAKQISRRPVVVLCDKSGDYSASKAAFSVEVGSVVEQSIKQCLGSLRY